MRCGWRVRPRPLQCPCQRQCLCSGVEAASAVGGPAAKATLSSWMTVGGRGAAAAVAAVAARLLPSALLAAPDALLLCAVSRHAHRLTGGGGAVVLLPLVRRALHVGQWFETGQGSVG